MEEINKRSKRSSNFSKMEENILICMVKKYKEIIESKKYDTLTNNAKIKTWVKISHEFNTLSKDTYRDFKTLKNKYENMKKRLRHQIMHGEKRESNVESLAGQLNLEENMESSDHDSHIPYQISQVKAEYDEDLVSESEQNSGDSGNNETANLPQGTEFSYSIENAVRMNSKRAKLKGRSASIISDNLNLWGSSKIEFSEIQRKCFMEEHKLKLLLMREKHNRNIELLQRESIVRLKHMEDEHLQRLEILELEKKLLLKKIITE